MSLTCSFLTDEVLTCERVLMYVTVVPLGSLYRSGTRNRAGGENLQPHHRAFRGRQREKYKSETHALSVTP